MTSSPLVQSCQLGRPLQPSASAAFALGFGAEGKDLRVTGHRLRLSSRRSSTERGVATV